MSPNPEEAAATANGCIRALCADWEEADRARLDRLTVYAVAVAEAMGFSDDALVAMRLAAAGLKQPDPDEAEVLAVVSEFDSESSNAPERGLDSASIIQALRLRPRSAEQSAVLEALAMVASKIQPIE